MRRAARAPKWLGFGTDAPGAPGQVFVPGRNGRLMMIPLRLGITDGKVTEVMAGSLTEGQAVITGPAVQRSGADAHSSLTKFRLQ